MNSFASCEYFPVLQVITEPDLEVLFVTPSQLTEQIAASHSVTPPRRGQNN